MPRGGFGRGGFGGGGFGRGGFGGGGFGRGGFGRGFGMRRYGAPLVMPMGGMGMGGGSPLLTSLLAGGVGYALGSNSGQQNQQPVYQPYPYQAPPPPAAAPVADNGQLAQLQLLGQLRESGVLNEDEFERQKQRILSA